MDKDSRSPTELSLSCARCGKPAFLQCPKCVELKLPRQGAAFCTQDCFKASWSLHKSVHVGSNLGNVSGSVPSNQSLDGWLYCLRKGQTRTSQLPHFDWTGTLRPYPISKWRLVPEEIEKPDWADSGVEPLAVEDSTS